MGFKRRAFLIGGAAIVGGGIFALMPCWNFTHSRGTLKNTVGRARCKSAEVWVCNYAPPGSDPDADLTTWYAEVNSGEPYDENPLAQDVVEALPAAPSQLGELEVRLEAPVEGDPGAEARAERDRQHAVIGHVGVVDRRRCSVGLDRKRRDIGRDDIQRTRQVSGEDVRAGATRDGIADRGVRCARQDERAVVGHRGVVDGRHARQRRAARCHRYERERLLASGTINITTGSDTIVRLNRIFVEQRRAKGEAVTQMQTVDWVI